jgi:hypothetical protein
MNRSAIFTSILPLFISALLCWSSFKVDMEKLLSIFLPIVWSILFALGGAIIFLNSDTGKGLSGNSDKKLTKQVTQLSLVLMLQTAMFLVLSTAYPAKDYLVSHLSKIELLKGNLDGLICFYQSLLFSLILTPSIFSMVVGGWCLYVATNKNATP